MKSKVFLLSLVLMVFVVPQLALADPITTDTTVDIFGSGNLMIDSGDNFWYVTKNASHVMIYSDVTGSWGLNSSSSDNYSSSVGFASAIDDNDVIHIADTSGATTQGWYRNFSTASGTWYNATMNWEGTHLRTIMADDVFYVNAPYFSNDSAYVHWINVTDGSTGALELNTSNDGNLRLNSITETLSNIYIVYATDIGETYLRIIDKSTQAFTGSEGMIDGEGVFGVDDSASTVVDYDNDEALVCNLEDESTDRLVCVGIDDTTYQSVRIFTISNYPILTNAARFSFARINSTVYGLFDVGTSVYAVEMTNNDITGNNYDFDFDNPLRIGTEDYVNQTSTDNLQVADTNESYMYFAYKNGTTYFNQAFLFTVNVFDEETGEVLDEWDLRLTNSTTSITDSNLTSWNGYFSGTDITVQVTRSGYATRTQTVIGDIGYGENAVVNVYMLNSSNGNYIRFHTWNSIDTNYEGVYITAYKFLNNSWTLMERSSTDSSGISLFFLDPTITYRVTTYNASCMNTTTNVLPAVEDYSFQLVCGADVNYTPSYYWTDLREITVDYDRSNAFCNSNNQGLFFYVNDAGSDLTDYGANFTIDGTSLWSVSGSNPTGANMTTTVDLTDYDGETGIAWFNYTKDGYDTWYFNKNYTVWYFNCANQGEMNTSIMNVVGKLQDGTYAIGEIASLILTIFICIVVVGSATAIKGYGAVGSVIIFILTFGIMRLIFTGVVGWASLPIFLMVALIGLAIAVVVGRW